MGYLRLNIVVFHLFLISTCLLSSCSGQDNGESPTPIPVVTPPPSSSATNGDGGGSSTASSTTQDYRLPNIDLSHWKLTLPIGNPTEIEPPEILDYGTNETVKPFFYNDSIDGSLVFYTYPGATTANSSYSRTELREQMEPGRNDVNWTFAEGGRIRGTLAVPDISTDAGGSKHRTIVMQIHGRLTNEQRDLIGEDDNNAPPIMKIYWVRGYVRLKSKLLGDLNATDTEALYTSAWVDDEGHTMNTYVGTSSFTLEIIASEARMEVVLNDSESYVYSGEHMERWGIFENYFKAGNYLATRDDGAFSKVKYYTLEVTHD